LGGGVLLVGLFTAGLVRAARWWAERGGHELDARVLGRILNDLPISFSTAMWLEGVGNGFVLWGVVLYAAGFAAWTRRPVHAIAWLVGYTLIYPVIALGWSLWNRVRPQVVFDGLADPGGFFRAFPSGHMVQASFAYGFLLWLWLQRSGSKLERVSAVALYLLLLLVVGVGRL